MPTSPGVLLEKSIPIKDYELLPHRSKLSTSHSQSVIILIHILDTL